MLGEPFFWLSTKCFLPDEKNSVGTKESLMLRGHVAFCKSHLSHGVPESAVLRSTYTLLIHCGLPDGPGFR